MAMPPKDDSRTGEIVRHPLDLTEEQVLVKLLEYLYNQRSQNRYP